VVRDDRSTPGLLIVALAGLALGCLAGLALVALFPFPVVAPPSSGVVGYVTVRGYPKSREAVYFLLIVLLVVTAEIACVASWVFSARFLARRRGLDPVDASLRDVLAYLPCFTGFGLGLLKPSGVATTFTLTVAAFVGAKLAMLAWPHGRSPLWSARPPAAVEHEPAAPTAVPRQAGRWFGAETVWPGATVALAGCVLGWFLPMTVPPGAARRLASASWLWPMVFVAGWLAATVRSVRRGDDKPERAATRAAVPFLPALVMSTVPFLIDYPRARTAVLGLGLAAMAGLFVVVVRHPPPRVGTTTRLVRACGIVGLTLVATAWIWEPDFPGIHVIPGDGDHLIAFLNDGLHGKLVYRDFWYPYGPLFYCLELSSARFAGLDRYWVPSWMITIPLGTLLLCLTARRVFLTWPFQILGSLLLFLLWTPQTVQWRVYAGYFTAVVAVAAAASGRTWALRGAGALAATAFLFSHEVAIAALVGSQAGFLWAARHPTLRETLRGYAFRLRPFLAGLAAILVPVALLGASTGTLVPYLRSTFGFVAVNDACCGVPIPNLRDELATAGQPLLIRLRHVARFLLKSPVFRYFYLPVLVYLVVAFLVVVRALRGRRPLRQDAVALGLAGFGVVLYRIALGRSDAAHAQFATVPALVLGCVLLERAALRGVCLLRGNNRPGRPRLEGLVEMAMLSAGVAFLGWGLQLPALRGALRNIAAKLAHYHELRHEPRPTWGLQPVLSARGGRFYFPDPIAPMVQATADYLRAHTGPGEGVFAFPYAFRYNVLLDRANPLKFGSCIWGAAARTADQRRLVAELTAANVRYIVYDESEWPDMDGVPTGDRFAELADFIFTRYAPERRIAGTTVLRLRDSFPSDPPSVVDVTLDEHRAFLHRGWYYPAAAESVLARWTSTRVTARLTRRATDRELFVDAHVYGPAENPPRWLTATVDGRRVGRLNLATVSGWTTLRFPLADAGEGTSPVLVGMDIDPFPAPWDNRRLGLIVTRLGLR
jgi:hypothetical protein